VHLLMCHTRSVKAPRMIGSLLLTNVAALFFDDSFILYKNKG
jgi:hypothetical protein